MTTLNDKEHKEEKKYALDQEKEFKIIARRNKLLGLWAAELMKLEGAEGIAYAKSVVLSDFEEPGDDDVFRKVHADLKAANAGVIDEQIKQKMAEFLTEAHKQIESEA
jgi:hypothetical protein